MSSTLHIKLLTYYASCNLVSKSGEANVMQCLNKCCPGHWRFATSNQPLMEDFCVDLFGVIVVFGSHAHDS